MADVVKSNFCILYCKLGSVFYPIACGKDVDVSMESDLLELAPRSSGDFREYEYGRKTGQISGSGLTKIDTAPDNLYSIFDLMGSQLSSQKMLVKFSMTDPQGNIKVLEVNTLIRTTGLSKSAGSIFGHSFTLQMSGVPVITTTPVANTNPQILVYEYTATGGEASLDLSAVFNPEVELLLVHINGLSKEIKISPAGYSADQVQYNPATQVLTFGTALVASDWVKIVYVDTALVVVTASLLTDGAGSYITDGAGGRLIMSP